MKTQPAFCPYRHDGTDGYSERLDALIASIDEVEHVREAKEAEKHARLRDRHDRALDAIMRMLGPVTHVLAISNRLDAVRPFNMDPYRIWDVSENNVGIFRSHEANGTCFYGMGIRLGSYSRVIALMPEQEYDKPKREYDVHYNGYHDTFEHRRIKAGVYYVSWDDDDESTIRCLNQFSDINWNDNDMRYVYERETDDLERLARAFAIPAFESIYWCYACDVVEEAKRAAEEA